MIATTHQRELLDRIKRHEGFGPIPYRCPAGKITGGYGRNFEAHPITEDEADQWLRRQLFVAQEEASAILRENGIEPALLAPTRQGVVAEMVFQLGANGTRSFVKMFNAMARQDWREASLEMLDSRWHEQTPVRCERLALIMETGEA